MEHDLVLARAVREWVEHELPGDRCAARGAVEVALASYSGGASVSEASEVARRFVSSWLHHPARATVEPQTRLRLVS